MKKVVGVILIILGAGGFFLGWVQLAVPPGAYGVMRSKTHGLDPGLIHEGEFRWVWYKLIPTNVSIQIFTLDRVNYAFELQDVLPSGGDYSSFAGFDVDFSYEVSAAFSFNIKPDSLSDLVANKNISNQAALDQYEENLTLEIEKFASQGLRLYMEDEKKITEILNSGSIAQLQNDIGAAFPDIENLTLFIRLSHFPDLTLYYSVRAIYQDYLARQREYIRTENTRHPEALFSAQLRLDELAKYGELLTKYPVLLQYLALEKGISLE